MSKSLSILQTIAKVVRIVCKVVFILCIVGGVGCLVGLAALLIFGSASALVTAFSDWTTVNVVLTGCFGCLTGVFGCAGGAVLSRMGERYFEHELAAGTPFTKDGAKELFRLGIASLIVSLSVSVLTAIVCGIFMIFTPAVSDADVSMSWSLGTGLTLLLLSVIFRYGAELREQNHEPKTEEGPVSEAPISEKPTPKEPSQEQPSEDTEQTPTQSFDIL